MKDLFNSITLKRVISPVSVSDNTAQTGQAVDRKGFESVTYAIATGSLADADATFTVLLQESDDNSTYTDVADADLLGTEALAGFQYDDDGEVRKIGYIGAKRYTKLTITPANNASAAVISAVCILGHAANQPTVNPPA